VLSKSMKPQPPKQFCTELIEILTAVPTMPPEQFSVKFSRSTKSVIQLAGEILPLSLHYQIERIKFIRTRDSLLRAGSWQNQGLRNDRLGALALR